MCVAADVLVDDEPLSDLQKHITNILFSLMKQFVNYIKQLFR
jgi:hypothetical protein